MAEPTKRDVFRKKAREMLLARGGKIDGQLSDFLRLVNSAIVEVNGARAVLSRTECFRAFKFMRQSGEVVVRYRNIGRRKVSESFELREVDADTNVQLRQAREKAVEKKPDSGFMKLRQFIALSNPEVQTAFEKLMQLALEAEGNRVDWRARAMLAEAKLLEIKSVLEEGEAETAKVVAKPDERVKPTVNPATAVVDAVKSVLKTGQKNKEISYKDVVALRLKVQHDLLTAASKGAHALEVALAQGRDELGIPANNDCRKKMAPYLGRIKGGFRGDFILRYTRNSSTAILGQQLVEFAEVYTKIDGKPVTVQMLVDEREAALKKEQARIARMQKGKAESRTNKKK